MNILQALDDPNVFGPFFKSPTWNVWRVFLAALFALPMTDEQLAIYQKYTGRTKAPTQPLHEAWLVIGRRGGKSFILATIAVFLACFKDWRPYLGPGEAATVMIIARDRRQARVIKRFITGLLKSVPMLAQTIENETQESIVLRNKVMIEIHTASFRSTRGYTICVALLDEAAYWEVSEESSEPDVEVINAIRPGQATVPDAMLLVASSPYARRGALWNTYTKHFGKDDDEVLVWKAATREMNATVRQSFIDMHMAEDPARASAEYMAEFRSDLEAFVSRDVIEQCTGDYFELQPSKSKSYYAFVDAAGGSGGDSFAVAIAHREDKRVVVDCVRERKPPFSPEAVVEEFSTLLKTYRVTKVTGDKWAGGFPPEAFQKRGIKYEPSEQRKSDIYRDCLPLLNSGRVTLPRNDRLFNQFVSLERRVARTGKDSIDHPRGQTDDLSNSTAGACVAAATRSGYDLAWEDGSWEKAWGMAPRLDATPEQKKAQEDRLYREGLRRHIFNSTGAWFR
jgi:hypothetical protein